MKRFGLMMILSSMFLMACRDQVAEQRWEQPFETENESLEIVYPLSKGYKASIVRTRGAVADFENDWENQQNITTASGYFFLTPWTDGQGDSNLPENFNFDIKKEDGWQLLFHTFSGTDYSAKDRNYMAFYNQRTGILKVFYYLRDAPSSNNGAAWEVSFNGNQRMLNMSGEITDPLNIEQIKYWKGNNFVVNPVKPFQAGWNGFQIPLAYDPTSITTGRSLDIRTSLTNVADVNLFGDMAAYSAGTILTQSSTNPMSGLSQKISTVIGKQAEQWINDKIEEGMAHPESSSTRSVVGGAIIGGLVKSGVNLIFSKLTASFSKFSTQRSDLEFTTHGTTHLSGTITFESSSPVLNLRAPFTKDLVGELGAWNLKDRPTIYVDPRADYVPDSELFGEFCYRMRGVRGYDYEVVINPKLKPHVIKQWVDVDLIRYWKWEPNAPKLPTYYTDFGSIGNTDYMGISAIFNEEQLLYGDKLTAGSVYRDDLRATVWAYAMDWVPMIYVPKVKTHEEQKYNVANIFMKVTLNLVTDFEGKRDTTISTRTFIPKMEWDPYICSRLEPLKPDQWEVYNNI